MAQIVFDLDGTLIDSAPDIQGVANGVLGAEGYQPITLEQTHSFIGEGTPTFVAKMRAARDIPDSEQDRLLAAFRVAYMNAHALTEIYPDVVSVLTALKQDGHALGICTNKPLAPAEAVLTHLNLRDLFDVVIGGDSLPLPKPDPAPLLAAFEALPEGPRIYVGDSEVDAETAQRASLPFLLYTKGYHKTPIDGIPKTAAFDNYNALPDLVRAHAK